jgi:hypothetical protein
MLGAIVDNDVVGDGVENLHPVTVGFIHAREEARIFKGDRRVADDGVQELFVGGCQNLATIREAQDADRLVASTGEAKDGAVFPAESGRERGAQQVGGLPRIETFGMLRQGFGQGMGEATFETAVGGLWPRGLKEDSGAQGGAFKQSQSCRLCTGKLGGAIDEATVEIGQVHQTAEFERQAH